MALIVARIVPLNASKIKSNIKILCNEIRFKSLQFQMIHFIKIPNELKNNIDMICHKKIFPSKMHLESCIVQIL